MRYTDNCSNLCVISYSEEEVTRLQKTSNDEDEKNMQDSFCSSLFFNCSFFLLWIEEKVLDLSSKVVQSASNKKS